MGNDKLNLQTHNAYSSRTICRIFAIVADTESFILHYWQAINKSILDTLVDAGLYLAQTGNSNWDCCCFHGGSFSKNNCPLWSITWCKTPENICHDLPYDGSLKGRRPFKDNSHQNLSVSSLSLFTSSHKTIWIFSLMARMDSEHLSSR